MDDRVQIKSHQTKDTRQDYVQSERKSDKGNVRHSKEVKPNGGEEIRSAKQNKN